MTEINKLGAEAYYHELKNQGLFGQSEVKVVSKMTQVCENLTHELECLQEDHLDYEIEMTEIQEEILATKEKEKKLLKEIQVLIAKSKTEGLTEEEGIKLGILKDELDNIREQRKPTAFPADISGEIKEVTDEATDYGKVTLNAGQKLADTKVKKENWFRKLFGITKKQHQKVAVGQKAVEVSTNLIDKAQNPPELQIAKPSGLDEPSLYEASEAVPIDVPVDEQTEELVPERTDDSENDQIKKPEDI